ncbi:MAG: acetate kinase, partial [Erysipelotrichaceae bacterium]|nr:acetate kinase [Erysipelotrichaceae bacterium]
PDEMDVYLNKKSGMLGVSGLSSDARDIENAVQQGNERAILTQKIYVNRVINVIGGYVMQLGHVDAISFTAGLGENDTHLREMILNGLKEALHLDINYEVNAKTRGKLQLISKKASNVALWVVPTNEELVIAKDTYEILGL